MQHAGNNFVNYKIAIAAAFLQFYLSILRIIVIEKSFNKTILQQ